VAADDVAGLADGGGGDDGVTRGAEQAGKRGGGGAVVLDEDDAGRAMAPRWWHVQNLCLSKNPISP
jgi:hypothetical protein